MKPLLSFFADDPPLLCEHYSGVGGGSEPASAYSMSDTRRETLHLGNLDRIIDRLQELFDYWEAHRVFPPAISVSVLHRARLAVHEWVANLIQHADFAGRLPEIGLSLWAEDQKLHGVITDNSQGFTLDLDIGMTLEDVCEALPDRGMGLLLLQACTDHLRYHSLGAEGHRLEFVIS